MDLERTHCWNGFNHFWNSQQTMMVIVYSDSVSQLAPGNQQRMMHSYVWATGRALVSLSQHKKTILLHRALRFGTVIL